MFRIFSAYDRLSVHLMESQISKGSKKRQGPTLGVRFSEMFVFKIQMSVERESSILENYFVISWRSNQTTG